MDDCERPVRRFQFGISRLLVGITLFLLVLGFSLRAGRLGIIIGVFHVSVVLVFAVLIKYRRRILCRLLFAGVTTNVITWAVFVFTHDAFVRLPYVGASHYKLDFAVIFGDAAREEHRSKRRKREALSADVQEFFYEGEVNFDFKQVTEFGNWYENRLGISESTGLHFNVETRLHSPMIRIVREELKGRGMFGSGSDVIYVWLIFRWVRVYTDTRWIS